MKLEAGMYARTKIGIFQITNDKTYIENKKEYIGVNGRYTAIEIDLIQKASHSIIDLIQVGDYVNGLKVYEVRNDIKGFGVVVFSDCSIHECQIKSIVTKEQFEQMEYIVEE